VYTLYMHMCMRLFVTPMMRLMEKNHRVVKHARAYDYIILLSSRKKKIYAREPTNWPEVYTAISSPPPAHCVTTRCLVAVALYCFDVEIKDKMFGLFYTYDSTKIISTREVNDAARTSYSVTFDSIARVLRVCVLNRDSVILRRKKLNPSKTSE
jgi:hypothetical protein